MTTNATDNITFSMPISRRSKRLLGFGGYKNGLSSITELTQRLPQMRQPTF
jgi:hypothetical protein